MGLSKVKERVHASIEVIVAFLVAIVGFASNGEIALLVCSGIAMLLLVSSDDYVQKWFYVDKAHAILVLVVILFAAAGLS